MHYQTHSKDNAFKCPKPGCKTSFSKTTHLEEHLRIHENHLFRCKFCNGRFVKEIRLKEHYAKHFKIKHCKCKVCGKSMTEKERKKHVKRRKLIFKLSVLFDNAVKRGLLSKP